MTEYYFDIETEGVDPLVDKIITIQFQEIANGKPVGDFHVLKEWEQGEKRIVEEILDRGVLDADWVFVPIGNNLKFDIIFVMEKAQQYGLQEWNAGKVKYYFFTKPMIDIRSVLVLMNEGKFKGSGLDAFTGKKKGVHVPIWYQEGKFDEVLTYIETEKDETLALYREVASILGTFGRRKRSPAEEREM
jgi:DNA polymerase III epsilon subunit-like protein